MKVIETKSRFNKTVCLRDELDDFMNYIGLDLRMQELQILNVWSDCVGPAIARFSTPVEIKKSKLLIRVENASWRYELSLKKDEIISKLNQTFNKKLIRDIIFV